jgi:hypothetical protein
MLDIVVSDKGNQPEYLFIHKTFQQDNPGFLKNKRWKKMMLLVELKNP